LLADLQQLLQTDQVSRSAGCGAAASVIVMDITIHSAFPEDDDPGASLGFEVRMAIACGGMRRLTVGPAGEPGTPISGLPVHL
jgi:hypothetical protein